MYIIVFSSTMGAYPKRDDIEALRARLHNEPMDSEANDFVEELNIYPDEGVELLFTKVVTR